MAQAASAYLEFRQLISTNYVAVTTQDREIELLSTNELPLTYPPATGVTTGATLDVGPSLAASSAAEDEAHFSVILMPGRSDRSLAPGARVWLRRLRPPEPRCRGQAVRRSEPALPLE